MKTIQLDDKLYEALEAFLEDYDNELGNRGCNDLSPEIEQLFSEEEGEKLAEEFAVYNNPKDPDEPGWPLPDYCLLALIRHKMRNQRV